MMGIANITTDYKTTLKGYEKPMSTALSARCQQHVKAVITHTQSNHNLPTNPHRTSITAGYVGWSICQDVVGWLLTNVSLQIVSSHITTHHQVRCGGIQRSSASPRPPCDGTPSSSVWPSPRQTPVPSCPYPSDRTPSDATMKS